MLNTGKLELSLSGQSKAVAYTHNGITKSVSDWGRSPNCVVNEKTLRWRLSHGWKLWRALTTPAFNPTYTAFGESTPRRLSEWIADSRCVVPASIVHTRLSQGFTLEEALTLPYGQRRKASK